MNKFLVLLFAVLFLIPVDAEWWDGKKFDWENSTELVPGIRYAHIEKKSPRLMNIWVMRVDLQKKFRFHTVKKAAEYGQPIPTHTHRQLIIHTKRQKTADFMMAHRKKGIDMVAAFNGSPWSPWDQIPSPYASRLGLLISDGELISPVLKGRPSFIVYKNGKIDFRTVAPEEKTDDIQLAVTGFATVIAKGKLAGQKKGLAPRTGYGLSADRRYFYVAVIDGRQQDFSMGCSTYEVGCILLYLGADDGVNMDGGGSSSFVIFNPNSQKAEMLNHQPLGRVRAVGSSLGISIAK
ncbi:MAG: phosphodiester glycosidase family protein [Lentisphaerae bacterium]|nr:phosphodiester glycosidase family protein [Lentisphaerota bacterium]